MSEKKQKSTLNTTIKSTLKNAFSRANPFDKKINKNDVSDTGTETVRLTYRSIKTVKKSVKTTQRTIKTTDSVVRSAGTVIYRTTAFTVKSAVAVSRAIGNFAVHTIAFMMNPAIIFFAVIIIIFITMTSFIVLLLGGSVSASNSNKQAYSSAAGLVDVLSQYQEGLEYLHTAIENQHNNFNSLIDSLYFDYDNLTYSDLVYYPLFQNIQICDII